MMDTPASQNILYITVLPRKASGNKLTFTALFTPHFATADAYNNMQSKWKDVAATFASNWTLTLKSLNAAGTTLQCFVQPVKNTFDRDVWDGIFHSKLGFKPRNKSERDRYRDAWFLSHDASGLHTRHQLYNGLHVYRQYLQHRANTTGNLPNSAADTAMRRFVPLAIYIPAVLASSAGSVTMSDLLSQRTAALNYKDRAKANFNSPGTIPANLIYTRIDHAVALLESAGQMLTAPALYAVCKHCVESALVVGSDNSQTPNKELRGYVDAIYKQAQGTVTPHGETIPAHTVPEDPSAIVTLDAIQKYIEFHLFAHPDKIPCEASGDPEFHQVVGLMHQYPALLRPLGLAIDFEGVDATDHTSGALYTSLSSPLVASIQPVSATQQLIEQFTTLQSLFTRCDGPPGFAASPRSSSRLSSGFLKLDPKVFTIVTTNADGTSQKLTQQVQSASTIEYNSSAPAGFHDRDLVRTSIDTFALSDPNPLKKLPSVRTVGLSLYQSDRDDALASAVAQNATGSEGDPFFADDLTLGYRMDVQQNNSGTWLSLHGRDSWYKIDLENHDTTWRPQDAGTASVLAADEGFITLAATQSSVTPPPDQVAEPTSLQVHVHQALVTWNGWSLSIPNPEKKQRGTDPPRSKCGPSRGTITVCPIYKLSKKGALPRLRFGYSYSVRLRQMDLAGNSVGLDASEPDGFSLKTQKPFARSEPIRAPHLLLETVIDRKQRPSEQIDRLVLRDGGESTSRLLVPPREPLRLAELHGLVNDTRPGSAFQYAVLVEETGAFPKVSDLPNHSASGDDRADNNDAIFRHGRSRPTLPYYPDPMARMVRINAFWLRPDLQTYQKINEKPIYLPFFIDPDADWTDVVPIRVQLEETDGEPTIEKNWGPLVERHPEILPGIPFLKVKLPEGETILLETNCCASAETHAARQLPSEMFRAFALELGAPPKAGVPPAKKMAPAPDTFPALHAFHAVQDALDEVKRLAAPVAPPPAHHASAVSPHMVRASFAVAGDATGRADDSITIQAGDLVTGGVHAVTPPQRLTLVHATRLPLFAPAFGTEFTVTRTFNATPASIKGAIQAHWNSTGKVTVEASWTDIIDDGKSAQLRTQTTREVPFEIVNSGDKPGQPCTIGVTERSLATTHQFRDTRARTVTYSLSATTRFREYYPESMDPDQFVVAGKSQSLSIVSSAVPPAVSLMYVLPAFGWREPKGSDALQRKQVLRVYLNRPFLVSGDAECVGVVLAPAGTTDCKGIPCELVTRWGGDPFDPAAGVDGRFMRKENFTGASCDDPQTGCTLQEGGTVDVLPFPIKFAEERGLWFCDIGIKQQQASSAFVRLALVRWQPFGMLADPTNKVPDCRLSQVVVADFMQIRSDRSVSVQRIDSLTVSVTLGGVFPGPHSVFSTRVLCTLEQRWHSLGRNLGWRPTGASQSFTAPANPGSGDGAWTATVKLPRSSNTHKFRLLIEEFETDGANFNRCTYVHYVEL